jgi:type IV secretion system protein VirB5
MTALVLLCTAPIANASGIPVVDGAHIGQTIMSHIEQVAKWVEQAKQMESQIGELQKQYEAMTGNRGMGSIPDQIKDQLLQVIANPPGWKDMRKKYPTMEGSPKLNAVYDVIAKGDARVEALQGLMGQRMGQVQSLMGRIDSAKDPAAKQDLMNRIASEQAAIQATEGLMKMALENQGAEIRRAQVEAMEEYRCQEFKCQ